MGVAENKATMRRLYDEAFNGGQVDVLAELVAGDLVDHTVGADPVDGPRHLGGLITATRAAFPDFRVTTLAMVGEHDLVTNRHVVDATHEGEFRGLAATGRRVRFDGISIMRFDDKARVVEHWSCVDYLSLLCQLGAVPPS